jgi:hypothetical protein
VQYIYSDPIEGGEVEIIRKSYSHMINSINPNQGEVIERRHKFTFKPPTASGENNDKKQNLKQSANKIVDKNKEKSISSSQQISYVSKGEAFLSVN